MKLVGCHYCLFVHKILRFGSVGFWAFIVRCSQGKHTEVCLSVCVHVLVSELPDVFPLCLMLESLTKIVILF